MRRRKALNLFFYLFASIILLLFIASLVLYIRYTTFELKDDYSINDSNLAFYSDSYESSRERFLNKTHLLKEQFAGLKTDSIQIISNRDQDLYMDICFIPSKDSDKLLILTSGIHGVETYVGGAIQQVFMEQYVDDSLLDECSLLLIHSINPYGFKQDRRATENNVDLNRNCDIDPFLFAKINQGYREIYPLINPTGPYNRKALYHRLFVFQAIRKIMKSGISSLRHAILEGQYEFQEGLFYGGNELEPQIVSIGELMDTICKPYKSILAIDIHTGYGERGRMHLFPNPVDSGVKRNLEYIYEGLEIDWGDKEDFYTVSGSFVDYLGQLNSGKKFMPMVFEFGTMDSHKTIGSLKSLHITISENQGRMNGFKNVKDSLNVMHAYKNMYFPDSKEWRSNAIDQFTSALDKVIPRYIGYESFD